MAVHEPTPFGGMVRRHRRALGLTQEELAERAGLSDRAIRQIERRDEHIPRKETVILLADALDLTGTEREAFQHAARRVGEIEHVDRVTPHESRARLPDERTSFIGREREIADVVALLSRPTVRLVTLTGPGGSGKTRLALQAATRLRPHFVDGVYFVSLASLSDSRLVPTVVAIELGFGDGGDAASSDALQAWLSEKHLLLVLDNFEHLLDASPMLQTLIEAAPGLCILVTSRTSLRLSPEYEYLVPPLSVPERRGVTSADTLLQYESVALFVDRAQAVRPGFTLDRENAPAVGEICSRLDGLPLAIELAAVRIRLFPPQALLGLLSSPLRILTGGPRDLPARQQTLRNTIEWSYRLLSEVEQTLFARLSVFAESWTLEAADAVCNAEGDLAMDPLDGMTSLTEKSLVISAENEGPPRFVMLETIREYAAERLQASAEYASLRQHHALYYVSLVETAEPQLRGAEEIRWFDQLLDERHNLRAALIWAREHEQVELGLRLAVALSMFWAVQGYLAEGRAWLDEFLARSNTDGRHRTAVSPHVHNRAINAAAYLAWVQGDAGAAIPLYEQSLSLSRQLGDRRITAEALLYLGCMSLDTHRVQRVSLLEESLSLAREIGAVELLHHVLFYLGRVAQTEGAIDRARSLYRESLTAARALGSQHELGCLLVWQAQALQLLGDDERARLLFEEGAAIARAAGDGAGAAAQLNSLALQARNQGDYEHATKILEEGLALQQDLRDDRGVGWQLSLLGLLAQEQGHYERATALYEESLALARTSNDKFGVAYALLGQGDIARSQGNAEEATAVCEEALQLLLELGNKIFAAYALNTLALAQRARGNREQARALLEEGLAVARESLGSAEPSLFTSMGMVALDESDADRAEASFCESLTYTRIRGPLYDVAMNLEGLASVAVLRGLAQRAAQLFGAADAIRTRIGIPMWPVNRLLHDRDVASVRAALGNEGFRIAWEAGYTMAVEQVIADAMQETAVPVTGTRLSIEGDREPGNRVD